MPRTVSPLLPATDALLRQLGERLRLARLRRKLSAKHVAQRAGMAPMTLRSVESGGAGVTIGAYVAVMQVLGVEQDLDLLAKADPAGRALQDARLLPASPRSKQSGPRTTLISDPTIGSRSSRRLADAAPHGAPERPRQREPASGRTVTARALAALLDVPPARGARSKRR